MEPMTKMRKSTPNGIRGRSTGFVRSRFLRFLGLFFTTDKTTLARQPGMIGPLMLRPLGGTLVVLGLLVSAASCAYERPKVVLGPLQALPEPRRAQRLPAPPEWYWEPIEVEVRAPAKVVELPVAEGSLVRIEGATRAWDELGPAGRERLLRDGVVIAPSKEARVRMGAFYMDIREQRTPYVLTLDALTYALHVAFEQALAEVDDTLVAPGLDALLARLEERLGAEAKGAGVELGEAIALARAIVAVARGLASPVLVMGEASTSTNVPMAAELGLAVKEEIARVNAHAGSARSPLLDAPIDYARFAVPPGAAHPGSYRALSWLAAAPLLFVAQSEMRDAAVGVATARLHTRAAMVLTRLTLRDVDPAIHALSARITRVLAFVWGPSDDLAPTELAEIAASIGVPLEDPKQVANVVTVDRLRKRAAQGRLPLLFDGSGAPTRAGSNLRLFGGHAPADSIALASLAGPALGKTSAGSPPTIARDGIRALPSALDLAAWLGAKEGRAALREGGLDVFPGYDAALAQAVALRPDEGAPSRHASVHGSLLDVLMTWLAPDPNAPRTLASPAAQRMAIESALAAWTFARHDAEPLSRPLSPRTARPVKDLEVRGAPLAAFVEQAPDVIARLVATVGQMKRGLAAVGGLPTTSPAMTSLAEVEDILRVALRTAIRETNDEELAAEDVSALASMPARLARLEDGAAASVPLVAEVVVDAAGDRSLSTATGVIEPCATIVREPGTGRLVLTIGAHIAHHELVEPRAERTTDVTLRIRVQPLSPHDTRSSYTGVFRLVR